MEKHSKLVGHTKLRRVPVLSLWTVIWSSLLYKMNSGSFSYTCLIYLFLFHLPFLYRESKKKKKKNLECEKMGGAYKYQNTPCVSSCLENARVGRNTAASSSFSIRASTAAADTPHRWVLLKKSHCSLGSCGVFLSAWGHELDGKISVGSLVTPLVSWLTLDRPCLS